MNVKKENNGRRLLDLTNAYLPLGTIILLVAGAITGMTAVGNFNTQLDLLNERQARNTEAIVMLAENQQGQFEVRLREIEDQLSVMEHSRFTEVEGLAMNHRLSSVEQQIERLILQISRLNNEP